MIITETKLCSICGEEKQLSEYYTQTHKKADGTEFTYYNPKCKECVKEISLKRHHENKEDANRRSREWYQKNREKVLEYMPKYLNQVKYKKKQKEWRQNNPEKVKDYRIKRETNKKHEISTREWEDCKKYFNHRCTYCGLAIEDHWIQFAGKNQLGDFHKEHVDDDGANDLSNCVPSCKSCNVSKRTSPFFEWYSPDNEHFEEERFFKILKWLTEDYKLYIKTKNK